MKMDVRKISRKQEKRIADRISKNVEKAHTQKASGALYYKKSDVVSKNFRVEAKTKATPSKQITLKAEFFTKLHREAIETDKIPVLVFSFGDGKDYYVLEEHDFMMMAGRLYGERDET
jgi:hypothetical protein